MSLLDMLKGFKTFNSTVVPHVVVGEYGSFFERLVSCGISTEIIPIPEFRKIQHFFKRAPFISRLAELCEQRRIEIIHANNHRVAAWSALVARKSGILSCCSIRTIIDARRARKSLVFENDRIMPVAKALQRAMGISDREKICPIYYGIDMPDFIAPDENLLSRLNIPRQSGKRVGFMGTLTKRKGPQLLIEAIPKVLSELPDTMFIFIGRGKQEFVEQLQTRAERLGVAGNVVFSGFLESGAKYLKILDLFVLPSLKEPLARVMKEAMYAGLPVVGANTGGTPEIVEHDRTGRLFPPGRPELLAQEILFYLKNDRIRKEHGELARQRATELFDITTCVGRMEELYMEMRESVKPKQKTG